MEEKKPKLRVLHLSTSLTWRGGEQQLAYLAEGLQERGIPQWIFCPRGSMMQAFCEKSGLAFFTFQKSFSLNPFVALKIAWMSKRLDVTVLHTHDSHAHTFSVLAALFGNKAAIAVHRRVDFKVGKTWFSRWKYNHSRVNKIICTSDFIRRVMAPAIQENSKLEVVHSGIDLEKFHFQKKEGQPPGLLRQTFSVPTGNFIIANVSAIAPHKDYPTFVRTAKILLEEGLPASFFIIGGDGGEEKRIRQFIRELNLDDHFYFTGHRSDVSQILTDIDLLLLTSKTEGFGGTVLGAFAAKVPVVATAAGGVPEVVEDGVTGLLAPVGDAHNLASAVLKIFNRPELRKMLTEDAYQKVRDFSKEKMVEGNLAVYRAILPTTSF